MSWLLRLFPSAWRTRYGDEFLALLESEPPRPRLVLDVLLAALDAWLRPQVGPQSISALRFANDEAEQFGHHYIGTEHLLLALLHDPDGAAMGVLRSLGVDAADARRAVESVVSQMPTGTEPTVMHTPAGGVRRLQPLPKHSGPQGRGLTPRARRAIQLGFREAQRLRCPYVGSEHLLLGLMSEGQGIAAGILSELGGVDLDELRRRVVLVRQGTRGVDPD